ncbi:MAG TPA: TetR/AcrR family transcriptional regulator [Aquabacterium sp.]|nr:TetR/AcrR family transcriptional regulator [Aquabacterium sp.]
MSSTPPPLKRRITPAERAQFRQELLDIARRILMSEGYAAVTIRRITAEAGVTPMAFYWYFDCKDAMLTVIWDDIIQQAVPLFEAAIDRAPPDRRLLACCEAMVDYWLTHRDYFHFIYVSEAPHVDMTRLRGQLLQMPGMKRVHALLFEQLEATLSEHADPTAKAQVCFMPVTYRLFGFLHSCIGLRNLSAADTATQKALLLADLEDSLRTWRNPGIPSLVTKSSNHP